MEIKNYEIEMLDVKAADAFIIHIKDENDTDHIILVDAGNYSDGQKIHNHLHKYYKSPIIDLAIVTHPDDDHFGGLIFLLEKIEKKESDAIHIKLFWVHEPGKHITATDVKYGWKEANVKAEANTALNCHENNLLEFIDKLKLNRVELFAASDGKTINGHPDYKLYVLGPTKEYYSSLIPDFRNDLKAKEEIDEDIDDSTITEGKIYSKTLDEAGDDPSKHNQSSLIFSFIPESDKRYLFLGDAGEEAFNNIPEHLKKFAKNVYWLKVPHHGSKHNMSNDMINIIKPKKAYISTEKKGYYLSQSVVNALKKAGCRLYSTHKERSSFLHHGIDDREGYSTADPL